MAAALDVLIVDDSPFFTEALGHFLRQQNLRVATLNDSKKVIEALKSDKPRLMVLDIMMPDLDGITLCSMIKSRDEFSGIRIAIYSTKFFEADKDKAYRAGAEAFITKDVPVEEAGGEVIRLLRQKMKIKFWGTRGSIPTPGPKTVRYGGNTSCVQVELGGDSTIIFDAGSGIRELGNYLSETQKRVKGHIFLTHFHWDHIQGLPFFAPAYQPENQFAIYGCEQHDAKLGKVLSDQMESVYFPVPLRRFGAGIQFQSLDEGSYSIESFRVKTMYLNHPSNTLGYLVLHRGASIGYITDNEFIGDVSAPEDGAVNDRFDGYNLKMIEFIKDADIIVIDAQYTKDEYKLKKGWGHSHYENVLEITMAAQVKKCVLFHHDPVRSDEDIDKIVRHCHQIIGHAGSTMDCLGAEEGLEIQL
jgi:phosphoribosyl 1,2-cyclic phosphodiesterase